MSFLNELAKQINEQPFDDPIVSDLPGDKTEIEKIEIYFDNLDNEAQKKIMDTIKNQVNATDDDKFSHDKIMQAFSKTPIFVVTPSELKRLLNIDL